jgi:uncharacterized membrane protein YbaN (DUF454 family)
MPRCCDGRNAYAPISEIRYYIGLIVFILFHYNFMCTMFLRHTFIKKYPHYETLKDFHNKYFSQMLREIRQRKGMCVGNKCRANEKHP